MSFGLDDISDLLAQHAQEERAKKRERASTPRGLWTYDTETDPFHHCQDSSCPKCYGLGRVPQPFLHGVYTESEDGTAEDYLEFESLDALVEWVQRQRALFYAHNGGRFDYHPLRPYMNTDENVMLINGRIARFRIGACEFRDSLNIFPNTRLADFGVKNEIDYEKMEPENRIIPAVRREISLYMRQDCKGLHQQVSRFRRDYGKSLTQAGATMKYWEKKHWLDKAPRQSKSQFDRCRPFYYGGRVQCFEAGVACTHFRVKDINSAYPRAMLEQHPISPAPSESRHLPKSTPHIQTSLIRLKCTAKGCFPWRDTTGELYFPDDDATAHSAPKMREYWVTGWEFLAALECDAVTNVHIIEVLTFAKLISFEQFIQDAYRDRMAAAEANDLAGKIFGKYRMNGLYGKFGADPSNYAEYVIATSDSMAMWQSRGYKEYQSWGEEKWMLERQPTTEELEDMTSRWRYYNVATAASITGYVRAFLFKAIHRCSGVIYCDTDSIAARDVSVLPEGKELGLWKDEGAFDRYAIAGKKLYAFHKADAAMQYNPKAEEKDRTWKIASKGVAFHQLEDGPDRIAILAQGGEQHYYPQVPTYSIKREQPLFINRSIRRTAKDIRIGPATGIL